MLLKCAVQRSNLLDPRRVPEARGEAGGAKARRRRVQAAVGEREAPRGQEVQVAARVAHAHHQPEPDALPTSGAYIMWD